MNLTNVARSSLDEVRKDYIKDLERREVADRAVLSAQLAPHASAQVFAG